MSSEDNFHVTDLPSGFIDLPKGVHRYQVLHSEIPTVSVSGPLVAPGVGIPRRNAFDPSRALVIASAVSPAEGQRPQDTISVLLCRWPQDDLRAPVDGINPYRNKLVLAISRNGNNIVTGSGWGARVRVTFVPSDMKYDRLRELTWDFIHRAAGSDRHRADVDATLIGDVAGSLALSLLPDTVSPDRLNFLSGRAAGNALTISPTTQQFVGVPLHANGFVTELAENVVRGLRIASTEANVRSSLQAFTTPLRYAATDHGVILMTVSWNVGVGDNVRIDLGSGTEDQSRQIYLSRFRTAMIDNGSSLIAGVEIDTIDVNAVIGNTRPKRGSISLRIARNSAGQIGYFLVYNTASSGAASTSGTVQATVEATLLRTGRNAPGCRTGAPGFGFACFRW